MRTLLAATVICLAFAACGDDVGDTPELTIPPGEDITTTASPAGDDDGDITAGGDCQDATEAEGQADLEMQDYAFAPTCLVISTSQGLRLHNEGQVEHNWSLETGLDVDVSPGDEVNTEATGLDPGTYTFFCKYHREEHDMEGELRVKAV